MRRNAEGCGEQQRGERPALVGLLVQLGSSIRNRADLEHLKPPEGQGAEDADRPQVQGALEVPSGRRRGACEHATECSRRPEGPLGLEWEHGVARKECEGSAERNQLQHLGRRTR